MTAPAAHPARERVLQPYFVKLQEWNRRIPGQASERAATVLIGQQRLAVEPWERGVIADWNDTGERESAARRMVMESLACMAKCMTDMERLGQHRPATVEVLYRRQAELMLDTAVAMALEREIQQTVDGAVACGNLDEARQLASMKGRLRRTVGAALRLIDESEYARIHALADTLTDVAPEPDRSVEDPATAPPATADVLEELDTRIDPAAPERRPAARRSERPARVARASSAAQSAPDENWPADAVDGPVTRRTGLPKRRKRLAALFGCTVLLWVAAVWIPGLLATRPPVLEPGELPDAELWPGLTSRHPSLYLDVDDRRWAELSHAGKWRAVEAVSDLIEPRGFDGLLVRDSARTPLAQWLRGRGIQLLGPDAEAGAAVRRLPRKR